MKILSLLLCFFMMQAGAEDSAPERNRLAMGFYYPALKNVANKMDIHTSLNFWVQEIALNGGLEESYSVLYDDIKEMNADFRERKIDMVVAPPLLLAIHFDRELLSDGFMGVQQLDKQDHILIIARQDMSSAKVNYLGKRLLLPENDLFAELFVDSEVIKQHHQPSERVFSEIHKVTKNQRIILDLFFDKADIAVVNESALDLMSEMNPQIKKKIYTIKVFPLLSRNYAYFHRDYAFQKKLKQEAYRFNAEPRGRQILEVFQMNAITDSLVDYLIQFDEFYQTYLKLNKPLSDD